MNSDTVHRYVALLFFERHVLYLYQIQCYNSVISLLCLSSEYIICVYTMLKFVILLTSDQLLCILFMSEEGLQIFYQLGYDCSAWEEGFGCAYRILFAWVTEDWITALSVVQFYGNVVSGIIVAIGQLCFFETKTCSFKCWVNSSRTQWNRLFREQTSPKCWWSNAISIVFNIEKP